jgi:hypothetical protein
MNFLLTETRWSAFKYDIKIIKKSCKLGLAGTILRIHRVCSSEVDKHLKSCTALMNIDCR